LSDKSTTRGLEPNLLLAIATVSSLALLIMTAALFGIEGGTVKYPLIALICVIAFVTGNGWMARRTGRVTPPMIHWDTPSTAVWAAILPLSLFLAAAIPPIWPGHDYGLLIVIASVVAGVAVESALKARKVQ